MDALPSDHGRDPGIDSGQERPVQQRATPPAPDGADGFIDPSRIVVVHISTDQWKVVQDGPESSDPMIQSCLKQASE
jgi:hypothetical protein